MLEVDDVAMGDNGDDNQEPVKWNGFDIIWADFDSLAYSPRISNDNRTADIVGRVGEEFVGDSGLVEE